MLKFSLSKVLPEATSPSAKKGKTFAEETARHLTFTTQPHGTAKMIFPEAIIRLPLWVVDFLEGCPVLWATHEERMGLAIALSRKNIENSANGPFGAAIFDERGILVAPGVNMVLSGGCSLFHAEMVALALAQKVVGGFDLSAHGGKSYRIYTSTEPCAMCLGALPWSGISQLVCGARDEDARAIGFDEGTKPSEWEKALQQRGILVMRDVLRSEAVSVLKRYAAQGGNIYNPRRG